MSASRRYRIQTLPTDSLESLNEIVAELLDFLERFTVERWPDGLLPEINGLHEALVEELQRRGVFFAYYVGSSESDPQEPDPASLEVFARFIETLWIEEGDDDRE